MSAAYRDTCPVKRSRALRGRNSTRDNRADGRVKDVPLPWRAAPGQPSLLVLWTPEPCLPNPGGLGARPPGSPTQKPEFPEMLERSHSRGL